MDELDRAHESVRGRTGPVSDALVASSVVDVSRRSRPSVQRGRPDFGLGLAGDA